MFDRMAYIKSNVWNDNEYLLEPVSTVKKCRKCHGLMYSVEFPNLPEAIDGVLDVCMRCFKKYGKHDAGISIHIRRCTSCDKEKSICEFRYTKNHNRINKKCADCVGDFPKF